MSVDTKRWREQMMNWHNDLAPQMIALLDEIERLRDVVACSMCGATDWQVHHCIECSDDRVGRWKMRSNWFEAAYDAGKAKLIERAVDKATAALREDLRRAVLLLRTHADPVATCYADAIANAHNLENGG